MNRAGVSRCGRRAERFGYLARSRIGPGQSLPAAWAGEGRVRARSRAGGLGHWRASAGRQHDTAVQVGQAPISVTAAAGSRLPDSGAPGDPDTRRTRRTTPSAGRQR